MWCHAVLPVISWTLLSNLLVQVAFATPNPLPLGPQCDKDLYGSPKIEDCNEAIFWIPKNNPNANSMHIFAEPQLLNPPFKAVENIFAPKAIIQLPKIFKYGESNNISSIQSIISVLALATLTFECILSGSCSIAIVVQPYGYDERLKPEFIYSWSSIANQVRQLQTCLDPPRTVADRTPQGGYKPLISPFPFH